MVESTDIVGKSHGQAWLAAILGWLLPGAGHLLQRRVSRAVLLGSIVWIMFLIGVDMGGHLYGFSETSGSLLSYVFGFCDLGSGLLYIIARAFGIAIAEQSQLPTSEYGNVFLMVSGLLNFLLSLDAFDIGVGRKR